MSTPFFPQLRPALAPLRQPSSRAVVRASLAQLERYLDGVFPAHLLAQHDDGPGSRDRIFTLCLTFQCFLWQILKPNTSCREVVRQVQALFTLKGWGKVDESSGAYCLARQRLPTETLATILKATAATADQRAGQSSCLAGRPVKVVDGSSVKLPDTPANQKSYPQPSEQTAGCGFPVLKFLALFSLNSGAILHTVTAKLTQHDLRLLPQLQDEFKAGDILLGDRAYGEYTTLAWWPTKGVDVVARLHQKRRVDFRQAKRLGKNDGLFTWTKSYQQSSVLTATAWKQLPATVTVRIIRFTAAIRGHKARRITLVTSLLDHQLYPAAELIALYARRWRMELCLRDLKTTMGMEHLRCQSPAMVQKELLLYLIGHNLIRCLMAHSVAAHQVELERLSFKGTVDAARQYTLMMLQAGSARKRKQLWENLLLSLARDLVPLRPGRREPRALKRRPKPFPLLTKPRHRFREIEHRNRHWKGKPRNYRALN